MVLLAFFENTEKADTHPKFEIKRDRRHPPNEIADTHPKLEMKTDRFPEQLKDGFVTSWSWSYWLFFMNISFG